MSQNKDALRLLLGNSAGFDALIKYLEEQIADMDSRLSQLARKVLFSRESLDRDCAIALHGKLQFAKELCEQLKSLETSTERE